MSTDIRAILEKTPCVQCDGSGGIQVGEDDYEQCQFCYQLRLPFIDQAEAQLKEWIKTEIIGEDEYVLSFAAAMDESTTQEDLDRERAKVARNTLRQEQKGRLE